MATIIRYRGSEQDPFLLAPSPLFASQPAGVYACTFQPALPDAMDEEGVRLPIDAFARLERVGSSTLMRWGALPILQPPPENRDVDEPGTLVARLRSGEGRSGFFLKRVELAVGPWPGRVTHKDRPSITFPLEVLEGVNIALWLDPDGDGFYIRDLCKPGDKETLTGWRERGALDAAPRPVD